MFLLLIYSLPVYITELYGFEHNTLVIPVLFLFLLVGLIRYGTSNLDKHCMGIERGREREREREREQGGRESSRGVDIDRESREGGRAGREREQGGRESREGERAGRERELKRSTYR